MHLSDDEFAGVIEDAIESIPEGFHKYLRDVVVDIEGIPDAKTCEELHLCDPRALLGLYRGTPLTQRHVEAPFRFPERIVIYQENIERICRSKAQMVDQIRRTVLHEVGHHFGLNEQQLRELGF